MSEKMRRSRGRPREFDHADALRAAMLVFWRFGYEGASLTLLTQAMGISKPTLYAAFGDKTKLFREVVQAYVALRAKEYAEAFALPTARAAAEACLRLTSGVMVLPDTPTGCLLTQSSLLCGEQEWAVRQEMVGLLLAATGRLKARFEQAQRDGDLTRQVDAGVLAEYVGALASGMAVQSTYGVTAEMLQRVVDTAMAGWVWDGDTEGERR